MEHEPQMKLDFGDGGEFEAVPDNTSLYRFFGHLACYNHVFIITERTDGEAVRGNYVFNQHPVYAQMEEYMVATGYPLHDNLRTIPQCDLDAYDTMIAQFTADVGDTVPEGWDDGSEK